MSVAVSGGSTREPIHSLRSSLTTSECKERDTMVRRGTEFPSESLCFPMFPKKLPATRKNTHLAHNLNAGFPGFSGCADPGPVNFEASRSAEARWLQHLDIHRLREAEEAMSGSAEHVPGSPLPEAEL